MAAAFTRVFTADGGEIDDLEDILDGDTLVFSSGGDFVPVAAAPSVVGQRCMWSCLPRFVVTKGGGGWLV